ncbi:MAG: hypothetical protein FJW14_03055 [Acidimicrobiia bacterium]|nr:hypothetical protein [Acidimicrobiia bacterium]
MALLAGTLVAAQQAGPVLPITAPRALPPDDAMVLTHFNRSPSFLGPCVGPGRVIRITEISETGWEAGPTAPGLTFYNPNGVALDAAGLLYLADRDNRRIVRMGDVAGTGWRAFAGSGSNILAPLGRQDGCVQSTHGVHDVAFDGAGRIYAATSNPWRIVRIDNMDGAGWTTFAMPGDTQFQVRAVALDARGRIYLSDNGRHRIIRIDDMSGRGLVTLGSFGNGVRQFNQPMEMTFDRHGRFYIADEYNHRIVRVDDMTGSGWITLGSYGSGIGQFAAPHGIVVDTTDRIHVADTGNDRYVRVDSMTGAGWVSFGNRELQGRDLEFSATKSMLVIGRGPVIPYLRVVPLVAAGGTHRTTLIAVNTGTEAVAATVALVRGNNRVCGRPCDGPMTVTVDGVAASSFERTIAPNGTMRLSAEGAAEAVTGYARLRSLDDLAAFAILQATRGGTVTSQAAVPAFDPADHFTIYVDNTHDARTALIFDNPRPEGREPPPPPPCDTCEPGWITMTATLRSKGGATIGTAPIRGNPPGYHVVHFVSQLFPEAGPGFEGTLEIDAGVGLRKAVATAIRYEHAGDAVFTLLPPVRHLEHPSRQTHFSGVALPVSTAVRRDYPHIADGGSYRTEFVLVNPTNAATTATMSFFGPDGSPLALPVRGGTSTGLAISLPPRGVERVVTAGTAAETRWGWARLTSPAAIDAIVVLQSMTDGAIRSEAAVWAASPAIRLRVYVSNAASTESGIAINNPNDSSVATTILLRDASGQVVASTAPTLPARGYLAQFVRQLFPGFEEFEGTIDVETNGGPLGALGLRYENATVFTTYPAAVVP